MTSTTADHIPTHADAARSAARPVALDGVAGWFHPAEGRRGVVIVPAFGYEDLCARGTLRLLAERLAAAGLPTLRIDLSDTGDAADLETTASRLDAWTADVIAAVARLRAETGISETVVVGLRLGALVATVAAERLGDVDHLVLMAPPPSGRALVRELSVLSRLIDGRAALAADGAIEVAGFRLAPATLEALATIDLARRERMPATAVTLVGDAATPSFCRVADAIAASGARVATLPFEGYARMMCDPTASEPAVETVERLAAELGRDLPDGRGRIADFGPASIVGAGWREEAFVFADGLAGILTLPASGVDPARSAIWLGAGRNHHVGWARQTVDLARRLATAGVAVLRMDFAGIGESPARPGQRSTLYHAEGRADVLVGLAEMERRGFRRPVLIGACSGAHQAFHAAVAEPRIGGIVLVNPLCFVWDASYAVHLSAWMRARPHQFEAEERRILDGDDEAAAPRSAAMRLLRDAARFAHGLMRRAFHLAGPGGTGLVERGFRTLAARGAPVSLVLSIGDKAEDEVALHLGRDAARIAGLPGFELVHIADADHSLTPAAARAALGDHLIARLARPTTATGSDRSGTAPVGRAFERAVTPTVAARLAVHREVTP